MNQADTDNTQARKSSKRVMGKVKTVSGHSSKCSSNHTQDTIHRSADIPSKIHNHSEGLRMDSAATVNRPRNLEKYLIAAEDRVADTNPGRCSRTYPIYLSIGTHISQHCDQEQLCESQGSVQDQPRQRTFALVSGLFFLFNISLINLLISFRIKSKGKLRASVALSHNLLLLNLYDLMSFFLPILIKHSLHLLFIRQVKKILHESNWKLI